MQYLTEQDFDTQTATGVALVDFYADRCGPCKILGKLIPHLANKYEGAALVAKVDTEQQFTLTQRFEVHALPTVVILKDGKEVERLRGLQPPEAYSAVLDKRLVA
jgi:thioredoxin 1